MTEPTQTRTGVLLGGSGLIGGTLLYHAKCDYESGIRVLSPNSKELSLRVPEDIRGFFRKIKADFIINCAIAELDSDPQMTVEVNCLGAVYLARVASELGIPYIHLSSAAVMENGEDVHEEDRLPLDTELANYAKGKLIAERAIEELGRTLDLDYTIIRLGIVYGTHDHKIRGIHRLLFSMIDGALPVLPTNRRSRHSYTNARKLPLFCAHALEHREEFRCQTYHFVDQEPVRLGDLMRAIKGHLGVRAPLDFYLPLPIARLFIRALPFLLKMIGRLGIEARVPSELIFLDRFYRSQVLSRAKLSASSFVDDSPDETILTMLPQLIKYYVQRWENLNLIHPLEKHWEGADTPADHFESQPELLLREMLAEANDSFLDSREAGDP